MVQLTTALGGWRPDVVHAHDWLVAWAGDTAAELCGRAPRRHHPRHREGPQRRLHPAGPARRHQRRRVVAHVPGRPGDRLLAVHGRRGPRRLRPAARQGRRRSPTASTSSRGLPPVAAHRRGADGPLVVSWGRLQYEKGFQFLIEAMSSPAAHMCPACALVIAGRGCYLSELRGARPVPRRGRHGRASPASCPTTSCAHLLHRPRAWSSRRCTSRSASSPSRRWPPARRSWPPRAAGWPRCSTAPAPGCCSRRATPAACRRRIERMLTEPGLAAAAPGRRPALVASKYAWDAIAAARPWRVYSRPLGTARAPERTSPRIGVSG